MKNKWEKISEEVIHKNPWWTYKHDKYRLPNNKEGDYYYVSILPGSIIIPILKIEDEIKIIMIKQFRYLADDYSVEFPMGGMKEGQTIEECALAELEEETGYKAKKLEFISKFFPYKGLAKDITNVFIARDLERTQVDFDETEEIEVLLKNPEEVDDLMRAGEISNGQMLAAWMLSREKIINNE